MNKVKLNKDQHVLKASFAKILNAMPGFIPMTFHDFSCFLFGDFVAQSL